MNILALDSATAVFSLAITAESGNWYMEIDAGQRHSELLMDATDQLMKISGLKPRDLDAVACMKGPGSFTGLRIGFATAKGICLSLGIPLYTIPTLDCMAAPYQSWPGMVLPVIDAKKYCYFTALYQGNERLSDYLDVDAPGLGGRIAEAMTRVNPAHGLLLLTGPDAERLYTALQGILTHTLWDRLRLDPSPQKGGARELLNLVKYRIAKKGSVVNNDDNEVFSGPLYLRKSDAELSREGI